MCGNDCQSNINDALPGDAILSIYATNDTDLQHALHGPERYVSHKRWPEYVDPKRKAKHTPVIFTRCTRCGQEDRFAGELANTMLVHSFAECFAHIAEQASRVPQLERELEEVRNEIPRPRDAW